MIRALSCPDECPICGADSGVIETSRRKDGAIRRRRRCKEHPDHRWSTFETRSLRAVQ